MKEIKVKMNNKTIFIPKIHATVDVIKLPKLTSFFETLKNVIIRGEMEEYKIWLEYMTLTQS